MLRNTKSPDNETSRPTSNASNFWDRVKIFQEPHFYYECIIMYKLCYWAFEDSGGGGNGGGGGGEG